MFVNTYRRKMQNTQSQPALSVVRRWRKPKQARSLTRVHRLQDVAAAAFATDAMLSLPHKSYVDQFIESIVRFFQVTPG